MAVNLDDLFRGIGQRMTQSAPVWQSAMNTPKPPDPIAQAQGPSQAPTNPWAAFAQQQQGPSDPFAAFGRQGGGGQDPYMALAAGQHGGAPDPYAQQSQSRGIGGSSDPYAVQHALHAVASAANQVNPTPNTGTFQANMALPMGAEQQGWYDKSKAIAGDLGLDGEIFARLMQHESANFDPNVISGARASSAGAQGIAQFMPATAKGYNVNPLDPDQALHGAARYFDNLLKQNGGDYRKAVIGYNGGQGAIDADARGSTYGESAAEVAAVLSPRQTPQATAAASNTNSQAPGSYVFPVQGWQGTVQNHWGEVSGGSDLFAARGTPVMAMRGGRVIESGVDHVGGNSVLIQGDDGNQYYYAHFDAPSPVKVGQTVTAGTYLGPVGDTGDAAGKGTHLHIGIGPSILLGADKNGGTGGSYPAVKLLQDVHDGVR